jgi:hypothetical protein
MFRTANSYVWQAILRTPIQQGASAAKLLTMKRESIAQIASLLPCAVLEKRERAGLNP